MRATVKAGQALIDQWQTQLLIIKMARDIKRQYQAKTSIQEAEAVQAWVKNHVEYVRDPHKAEMISDPVWTLTKGGDCDDQAILAGALLGSIGHSCQFAAVQWKGKTAPTHAVCYDSTIRAVVDPVSVDPQSWPPEGYEVDHLVMMKEGEIVSLEGIFAKFHSWYSKQWNKVFKPHTLLGKLSDPLGLSSRNIKWGKKTADVVGTAAAIVAAGYGIGALAAGGYLGTGAAGTAAGGSGGFFGTALTGAKVAGTAITGGYFGGGSAAAAGAGTTAGSAGAAGAASTAGGAGFWATAGKTVGLSLLSGALNKQEEPPQQQTDPYAGMVNYSGQGFGAESAGGYSGGGGGAGYGAYSPMGPTDEQLAQAQAQPEESSSLPVVLLGAAALGLFLLTRKKGK